MTNQRHTIRKVLVGKSYQWEVLVFQDNGTHSTIGLFPQRKAAEDCVKDAKRKAEAHLDALYRR